MRRPPYAKEVLLATNGYWNRGTKVLIFAGPRAWEFVRPWLDETDPTILPQARKRYTLCLPPDMTAHAEVLHWPVHAKPVVIVNCGADDAETEFAPLIAALQRDGCGEGEVLDAHLYRPAFWLHDRLRAFQPWRHAEWDADIMESYARAQRESVERDETRLIDAWAQRLERAPVVDELCLREMPPGSLGSAVADRLKHRRWERAVEIVREGRRSEAASFVLEVEDRDPAFAARMSVALYPFAASVHQAKANGRDVDLEHVEREFYRVTHDLVELRSLHERARAALSKAGLA